jgi:hypothetical protein
MIEADCAKSILKCLTFSQLDIDIIVSSDSRFVTHSQNNNTEYNLQV